MPLLSFNTLTTDRHKTLEMNKTWPWSIYGSGLFPQTIVLYSFVANDSISQDLATSSCLVHGAVKNVVSVIFVVQPIIVRIV